MHYAISLQILLQFNSLKRRESSHIIKFKPEFFKLMNKDVHKKIKDLGTTSKFDILKDQKQAKGVLLSLI